MDEIYRKALKRRDELISELREIDKFLRTFERLRFGETVAPTPQADLPLVDRITGVESSESFEPADPSIVLPAARKILLDAGRPMKRSELRWHLEAQGHVLPGKDKTKVLGTNLWRSGQFLHLEAGYWPKDAPIPAPTGQSRT